MSVNAPLMRRERAASTRRYWLFGEILIMFTRIDFGTCQHLATSDRVGVDHVRHERASVANREDISIVSVKVSNVVF